MAKSAANIDFTSDPFWLSTWDRESRKLARWSILALQSTETLTGRCDSDINCNSGPSWQSSIDFKERNLGFHSCKDQVWFVAHCQGVEQEVSLVPLTVPRDQDG